MVGVVIASIGVVLLLTIASLTRSHVTDLVDRSKRDRSDRTLRFAPQTGSMTTGRDRVPSGWYMTPAELVEPGNHQNPAYEGQHAIPVSSIRWWTAGGAAFVLLDVAAWVADYSALGVIMTVGALLFFGFAWHAWRTNTWFVQARQWNTGHRHDFPPTGVKD
jgi:hypothetical protein